MLLACSLDREAPAIIDIELDDKVPAAILSSDEEGPKVAPKAKAKVAPPLEVRCELLGSCFRVQVLDDEAFEGLEERALELAEACLRGLKPEARAARIAKVKHSILVRLKQAALEPEKPVIQREELQEAEPEPFVPPPPPPEVWQKPKEVEKAS